ncbi:transglutaminaseTgpA domain-containing protein [Salipaludibacillus daqingensis]|uniref:transglutaminaseTgpA domain-containing protein n=1 Tax=Salipaludibacillus daqingensis TaxID=3041001 RepID=UPI00247618AF|nr:transglutaminaseTgpA domain-containing protein [Salipaludibacillus daqingensis]
MGRLRAQPANTITHLFIYILTLLLLWEWLRPIPVVTNTADIHLFVWFAFFSAALIYLRVPYWLTVPILLTSSVYGLHFIFHEGAFLSREGGWETVKLFSSEFWFNSSLIISGEFANLTDPFRTFLLFMLLALICYLLYFWIFETRRIFVFLLSTIIYITILDTFTPIDASSAIVRIVVIGFFMLTLLHMLKVQEQEMKIGRRATSFISPAWMYTLIFMIGVATFIGVIAPKPEPQWSDPVPQMRSFVLGEGSGTGSGIRRVGYGENDERLGGGFVQDNNPVFRAEVEDASYWRGESKHYYTGQGWISEPTNVDSNYIFEDEIDYYMYDDLAELEEREVSIEMEEGVGFSHFFYPGQLKQVDLETLTYLADGNEGDVGQLTFQTDVVGGRVEASSEQFDTTLKSYDLIYDEPTFPIETLKAVDEDDPEDVKELYLQLPDDLPDRVVELAEEIVEDEDNRYNMAVAVEQYFSENDFEYETSNVPVPDEGEDYVDQFLFETQLGYCDNYSTSMAVMLRALDIPARWVKGFTAGEEVDEADGDRSVYEISNSNAHSWVEVYFPGVGWVPFEPTQGFDNYVEFEEEEVEIELDLDNGADQDDMPDAGLEEEFPELDEELEGATGQTDSGTDRFRGQMSEFVTLKAVLISIFVLVMTMVIYEKQSRLQNYYFLWHYRMIGNDNRYTIAYQRLMWILANEGLPRGEGETLREYATRVDLGLNSQSMSKLTKTYEKIYYGKYEADGEWTKLQKDWEEIIKALNA